MTIPAGDVPEWVHLLLLGPEFDTFDGHKFRMSELAKVVADCM